MQLCIASGTMSTLGYLNVDFGVFDRIEGAKTKRLSYFVQAM